VGALVIMIPWAISYATFPRLAALPDDDARRLAMRLFRLALASALLTGSLLMVATPFLIPALFGGAFKSAVVPTLILIPGGVISAMQGILGRSLAARGAPKILLLFASLDALIMCSLDAFVIGPFGIRGAATVSTLSTVFSSAVVLWYARNSDATRIALTELVPRWRDFRSLAAIGARTARGGWDTFVKREAPAPVAGS
jgi:O-antigen/teichoic acid export membrane protein